MKGGGGGQGADLVAWDRLWANLTLWRTRWQYRLCGREVGGSEEESRALSIFISMSFVHPIHSVGKGLFSPTLSGLLQAMASFEFLRTMARGASVMGPK